MNEKYQIIHGFFLKYKKRNIHFKVEIKVEKLIHFHLVAYFLAAWL